MRVRDEDEEDVPELNMAPLIDCIFLLLIFFLLTSSLQKLEDDRQQAVQQLFVELPESAAASAAPARTEPLVIAVDESGRVYLEGQRVGVEQLHARLRTAGREQRRIRIEGDRRAAFEHIVHVIDLCEFEGLRDIAVRTCNE